MAFTHTESAPHCTGSKIDAATGAVRHTGNRGWQQGDGGTRRCQPRRQQRRCHPRVLIRDAKARLHVGAGESECGDVVHGGGC